MTEEVAAQPVLHVPPGVEDEDARPGTDERLGDGEHGDQRCVANHQGGNARRRAGASPSASIAPLISQGIVSERAFVAPRQRQPKKMPATSGRSRATQPPQAMEGRDAGDTRASIRDRVRFSYLRD